MPDYNVRSIREDELEDMLELTSTAYNSSKETFRRIYEDDPFYDFELTRVADLGGRLIGYLRAAPRTIWIGSSQVKMGGIAEVCTHREFRRKGVASHLLESMVDLMSRKGYPLSMLYGRQEFYGRLGWERCGIVQVVRVPRDQVPPYKEAGSVRDFEEGDLQGVMESYDASYRGRSCAMVRDELHWTGRILRRAKVSVYDDDGIKGYMAHSLREERVKDGRRRVLHVQEAGGLGSRAIRGLVGGLSSMEGYDSVAYGGVAGDQMLSALSIPGGAVTFHWDGMFRVNDVMQALKGIADGFCGFRGRLCLRTRDDLVEANTDAFTIEGSGEGVTVERGEKGSDWLEVDIRDLSQLVPGTYSAAQMASLGKIQYSSPKAIDLADQLFPQRKPMQPSLDHF
jgi:predicted acetyltransferase